MQNLSSLSRVHADSDLSSPCRLRLGPKMSVLENLVANHLSRIEGRIDPLPIRDDFPYDSCRHYELHQIAQKILTTTAERLSVAIPRIYTTATSSVGRENYNQETELQTSYIIENQIEYKGEKSESLDSPPSTTTANGRTAVMHQWWPDVEVSVQQSASAIPSDHL
ncbi:hypothetical protein CR513_00951, partial [Mucuna pruriens]